MTIKVNAEVGHYPLHREHRTRVLSSRELLVLQLRGRGYSPQRIAALTVQGIADVVALEQSACAALGTFDVCEAVATARRRSLIL